MAVTVFISTPLPPEFVETIRAIDPARVEVVYEPDLHPPIRYIADHKGPPSFKRTSEQQERLQKHLGRTEVLWDFPPFNPDGTSGMIHAPKVRWIQGMSTGIGQKVKVHGLVDTDVICTSARGIHGGPIAEFAFLGILMHIRGLRYLEDEQRNHRWAAYCTDELAGKTMAIIGAGHMASKVAALGRAFDMRMTAMGRTYRPERAKELGVDRFYPREQLRDMLAEADVLVMTVPHTPETVKMIDAAALAALKPGSVFVNIGRGQAVDEVALIEALRSKHIAFAALDVFEVEPLPASSPLWDLPNVLISPHSASAMPTENERLIEIFSHNLRCYLDGRLGEMRNIIDKQKLY